jgi:hypothetical protein
MEQPKCHSCALFALQFLFLYREFPLMVPINQKVLFSYKNSATLQYQWAYQISGLTKKCSNYTPGAACHKTYQKLVYFIVHQQQE